jgi:hypothetical protein
MAGGKEDRVRSALLERWRTHGRLKAWGTQGTDSTYVLAAPRMITRLK